MHTYTLRNCSVLLNMTENELTIEVVRSIRRKKTIQAKMVGEKLVVYLPIGLSKKEESEWIEKMRDKVTKKRLRKELNNEDYLTSRFNTFNKRYFNNKLKVHSIKYVTNQNTRSGSCTPVRGTIRLSHKLADMPKWVLDYVIMHEMAHLVHPDHSKKFWQKVNEYRYTERARGFLICRGMEDGDAI
jgi:predicted metal-dependent hydrolase